MYIDNKQLKNQISLWLEFIFFIISLMIIVGGLTRLTDSGLSITKWELFSGFLPPLNDLDWQRYFNLYKEIPEFKFQNYNMSLNEFKIIFWWEWTHRFLGRFIGISFLIPLFYFSFKTNIKNLLRFYFIFFLICFQGFIGWYMVSSGLIHRVDVSHFRLSIHLIVAFLILSLVLWNYLKLKKIKFSLFKINYFFPFILLLMIFCQITLGAFVSGMDAGKIYNSWPMMGSNYFPDDSHLIDLFKLSAFSDPSLVQFIHRNLAYLIFIFYFFIAYNVYKKKLTRFFKIIIVLGIILTLQIVLGIFTLLTGAQIITSSMHQISSIFLVSTCIYLIYINSNSN